MNTERTNEILQIIRAHPGCTVSDIQRVLKTRAQLSRLFSEDSFIANWFARLHLSFREIDMHVWRLQDLGWIRLEQNEQDRSSKVHYYAWD